VVIVAINADDARAVHSGVQHLAGSKSAGMNTPRIEPLLRACAATAIRQIAGGAAADRLGTQSGVPRPAPWPTPRSLKDSEGSNRIILKEEIFYAPLSGQLT